MTMTTRVSAPWLFYFFALLIIGVGGLDVYQILHQPVAAPPSSTQPPPPRPPAASQCFAGDKVVVGYEVFPPLLNDSPPQPGGFVREVVDHVLHDVGCQDRDIDWRPLTADPHIDLVAAPPAQMQALKPSGQWTTTKNYAVVNLRIVTNKGRKLDAEKDKIVIDQQWIEVVRQSYAKGQPALNAVEAFAGKNPRAAITPATDTTSFDKNLYEAVPLPITLALAVTKKHERSIPVLNDAITKAKPFIETTAKQKQLASVQAAN